MTQETETPSTETTETPEVEQTPSLDDVYKQFNVEETARSFQPQPPAPEPMRQPEQQPTAVPDPILEADRYRQWATGQSSEVSHLKQSFEQLQKQLGTLAAERIRAREEADIKDAVQTVKKAGFEQDDDFIEIALGQKARQDQKFMHLYQNRHQNPQAWKAAVGAYANELKGKYAFRADPQIAENVRAAKSSTSATPNKTEVPNSAEAYLNEAKDQRDWDRRWQEIVSRGRY